MKPRSEQGRAALRGLAPDLWAALAYLALSCVYARRVVTHFGSHLAGHGGDGWQNFWNMWWFRQALFSGANPWHTELLHQPFGTTLLFHTLSPLNCLLSLPVDLLWGQPAAYNVVFLFSFAASGFTMYLLAKEVWGDAMGAFAAGCVFTFSHYHFAHAQGHLNLSAMQWVPLFLCFLLRVWRRRRLRDGALMGGALALTAFTELYYVMFAVFIAGLAALAAVATQPRRVLDKQLLGAVAAGVLVFLGSGGVLVSAILSAYGGTELVDVHDPVYWSADLQGFFVPGWISAWAGSFQPIWQRWSGNDAECSWYLGYGVLTLCALAFALRRPGIRPWAWGGLVLVGLILALGPYLRWGGQVWEGLPMPFSWLQAVLPFVKMSGVPGRWHFLALVGSAVLAGGGIAALGAALRRAGRGRTWQHALPLLCLAVVLAELAPRWIESHPLVLPGFSAELAQEAPQELVYDLGDWNEALLRQTGHGHPMVGGYISRHTVQAEAFLRHSPLLRALRGEGVMPRDQLLQGCRELKLRFLIVPDGHRAELAARAMDLQPRWRDGGLTVWELPLE